MAGPGTERDRGNTGDGEFSTITRIIYYNLSQMGSAKTLTDCWCLFGREKWK